MWVTTSISEKKTREEHPKQLQLFKKTNSEGGYVYEFSSCKPMAAPKTTPYIRKKHTWKPNHRFGS